MTRWYVEKSQKPTNNLPIHEEFPLNLEIPIFLGLLLGIGVFSALQKSVKAVDLVIAEDIPTPDKDKEWRSPLNSEGGR